MLQTLTDRQLKIRLATSMIGSPHDEEAIRREMVRRETAYIDRPHPCLNCGRPTSGPAYCPTCSVEEYRR